jgi:hypothetical protein
MRRAASTTSNSQSKLPLPFFAEQPGTHLEICKASENGGGQRWQLVTKPFDAEVDPLPPLRPNLDKHPALNIRAMWNWIRTMNRLSSRGLGPTMVCLAHLDMDLRVQDTKPRVQAAVFGSF